MSSKWMRGIPALGVFLLALIVFSACSTPPTPPPTPTFVTTPTPVLTSTPTIVPTPTLAIPFQAEWESSGHADREAEAFNHWNEEDPVEIPVECAKCHSSAGFQDYVGADGSAFGAVETAHEIGSVVTCETCHNNGTVGLSSVMFPSGAEVAGLTGEAICMTCHQGTASMVQVDEAIQASGAAGEDDTVSADLGFTNIHYYAAAVTRFGKVVSGGYQYEGKQYDALFDHVEGISTCVDCHDPHTSEVKVELCAECHSVSTKEELSSIRMLSSTQDYDGDGDISEPIAQEIAGLREILLATIQRYASEVSGTPVVYSADAYPYFFIDTNADGEITEDEAIYPNLYNAWTPRLAKAAYNYQTSIKDPGQYAHGGKYIIELVYDSIENLNEALDTPVDLVAAHRIDAGHFAGSEEAFRHWDTEAPVPANCAKCHTGSGLPMFIENGVNLPAQPSNGLLCETCHNDLTSFTRYEVESVRFPSGAEVTLDTLDNNLCLQCHQGRESTVSINNVIQGLSPDQSSETLSFRNVHYFAAGASLFGTEVKGAYEFNNRQYLGRNEHVEAFNTCTECHDAHALEPITAECETCHATTNPEEIRDEESTADYDGDGDVTEGISTEIATMEEALYTALQSYATTRLDAPILYDPVRYPYFFGDVNANGTVDEDETGYAAWSPRLLQSAYNYQFVQKDPGSYAHNGMYILQILYDSIQNVGGNLQGMRRP